MGGREALPQSSEPASGAAQPALFIWAASFTQTVLCLLIAQVCIVSDDLEIAMLGPDVVPRFPGQAVFSTSCGALIQVRACSV